jgi:hypothetical protein
MTILTPRLSSVAEAAGSGGHQEKRLVVQGAKEEAPEINECPNVLARSKVDDDDQ